MILSKVTVTNINKDEDAEFIENLAKENKCQTKRYYQAKDNYYVKYDYEPFDMTNFTITLELTGEDKKLDFIKYLFDKRITEIKHLQQCMSIA